MRFWPRKKQEPEIRDHPEKQQIRIEPETKRNMTEWREPTDKRGDVPEPTPIDEPTATRSTSQETAPFESSENFLDSELNSHFGIFSNRIVVIAPNDKDSYHNGLAIYSGGEAVQDTARNGDVRGLQAAIRNYGRIISQKAAKNDSKYAGFSEFPSAVYIIMGSELFNAVWISSDGSGFVLSVDKGEGEKATIRHSIKDDKSLILDKKSPQHKPPFYLSNFGINFFDAKRAEEEFGIDAELIKDLIDEHCAFIVYRPNNFDRDRVKEEIKTLDGNVIPKLKPMAKIEYLCGEISQTAFWYENAPIFTIGHSFFENIRTPFEDFEPSHGFLDFLYLEKEGGNIILKINPIAKREINPISDELIQLRLKKTGGELIINEKRENGETCGVSVIRKIGESEDKIFDCSITRLDGASDEEEKTKAAPQKSSGKSAVKSHQVKQPQPSQSQPRPSTDQPAPSQNVKHGIGTTIRKQRFSEIKKIEIEKEKQEATQASAMLNNEPHYKLEYRAISSSQMDTVGHYGITEWHTQKYFNRIQDKVGGRELFFFGYDNAETREQYGSDWVKPEKSLLTFTLDTNEKLAIHVMSERIWALFEEKDESELLIKDQAISGKNRLKKQIRFERLAQNGATDFYLKYIPLNSKKIKYVENDYCLRYMALLDVEPDIGVIPQSKWANGWILGGRYLHYDNEEAQYFNKLLSNVWLWDLNGNPVQGDSDFVESCYINSLSRLHTLFNKDGRICNISQLLPVIILDDSLNLKKVLPPFVPKTDKFKQKSDNFGEWIALWDDILNEQDSILQANLESENLDIYQLMNRDLILTGNTVWRYYNPNQEKTEEASVEKPKESDRDSQEKVKPKPDTLRKSRQVHKKDSAIEDAFEKEKDISLSVTAGKKNEEETAKTTENGQLSSKEEAPDKEAKTVEEVKKSETAKESETTTGDIPEKKPEFEETKTAQKEKAEVLKEDAQKIQEEPATVTVGSVEFNADGLINGRQFRTTGWLINRNFLPMHFKYSGDEISLVSGPGEPAMTVTQELIAKPSELSIGVFLELDIHPNPEEYIKDLPGDAFIEIRNIDHKAIKFLVHQISSVAEKWRLKTESEKTILASNYPVFWKSAKDTDDFQKIIDGIIPEGKGILMLGNGRLIEFSN